MKNVYFLSDFGDSEVYAGVVRSVLRQLAPHARVVDLAHQLPPGDLRHAAYQLYAALPYLQKGSLLLAVVDPGVGGPRRALYLEGEKLGYILPDNGIFTLAQQLDPPQKVWRLQPERFAGEVSGTFHARDVFAPAAAHLARGLPPRALGEEVDPDSLVRLPLEISDSDAGEIITFDRFGNALSNLRPSRLPEAVHIAGRRIVFECCYTAVPAGEAVAYLGSAGLVEVGVRDGSAREKLKLYQGAPLGLHWSEEEPPPLEFD